MRLWIIGNGFDLYHGLKTKYSDYKAYLCQHHTCKKECGRVPIKNLPQEVCRNCCKKNCENGCRDRSCPVRKFNDLPRGASGKCAWRDLEGDSYFDIEQMLKSTDGYHDKNSESMESPAIHLLHGYLDFARIFTGAEFYDWFCSVEADMPKDKKIQFLDEGRHDVFLTFNYTNTLQNVYHVDRERIWHVHGSVEQVAKALEREKEEDKWINKAYIAHNCLEFGSPYLTKDAVDTIVDRYAKEQNLSVEKTEKLRRCLSRLIKFLNKNIQDRLVLVKKFVAEKCSDFAALEEVVVAGHSLSQIDSPYLDYLADYFKCVRWRFFHNGNEDIHRVFEFCERHRLDGSCVPWDGPTKSILGGVPCQDQGGVYCPGFSICWSNKQS